MKNQTAERMFLVIALISLACTMAGLGWFAASSSCRLEGMAGDIATVLYTTLGGLLLALFYIFLVQLVMILDVWRDDRRPDEAGEVIDRFAVCAEDVVANAGIFELVIYHVVCRTPAPDDLVDKGFIYAVRAGGSEHAYCGSVRYGTSRRAYLKAKVEGSERMRECVDELRSRMQDLTCVH